MKSETPYPISPRDYAAAILAEPSRERRQQLLQACPAHWRDQVREYVESTFAKAAAYRQHKAGRLQQAREKPPAARRREDPPSPPDYRSSAPEVGNRHLANIRAAIGQGAA